MPDSRSCRKCGQIKPLEAFDLAPRGLYGRAARCKECRAAEYLEKHPPRPRVGKKRREAFTGDEVRTCTGCGLTKPVRDFNLSRAATETRNAVYRSRCKSCQSAAAVQWFRDHPERAAASKRRLNLEKNYGLTVEQYSALLGSQGGVCAICGNDEPAAHGRTGKKFSLAVDHDHITGRVRGLLCQKCNRAIGLLGDAPDTLQRAIAYLAAAVEASHA